MAFLLVSGLPLAQLPRSDEQVVSSGGRCSRRGGLGASVDLWRDARVVPERRHTVGIIDEAKAKAEGLLDADKVNSVLDKVEDFVNDKTGDKFADKVDQVTDSVKERLGGQAD